MKFSPGWMRTLAARGVLAASVIMSVALMGQTVHADHAANHAPPKSLSRYVGVANNSDPLYLRDSLGGTTWGCQHGLEDNQIPGKRDSLVVLNFGQPAFEGGIYGSYRFDPDFSFTSRYEIAQTAKDYARHWWDCATLDAVSELTIAVGTNNLGSKTTFGHGADWGHIVNDVQQYILSSGYASQIRALGASDMEQDKDEGWSSGAVTRVWVDGYNSTAGPGRVLYDYGSANECPSYPTDRNEPCEDEWTQDDVWYVSWGSTGRNWPVPLIFRNDSLNADQWHSIAVYTWRFKGFNKMLFDGPMTQETACAQRGCPSNTDNTPAQAWQQLWSKLASTNVTQNTPQLWYSTDIAWQCGPSSCP